MAIKVVEQGLATTIQDLGRPGYYHLGIPISGAMDRLALRSANLLVGNDEHAACLEAVFTGPHLECTQDAVIAVTGADLPPLIDGVEQQTWTTLHVRKGQVLSFDYLREGARAYIAIAGGIDTPKTLGSRSTYAIGALGGIDGRAINAGDILPIGPVVRSCPKEGTNIPVALRRSLDRTTQLHVLPGLYNHRITSVAQERFFSETWKVAGEADRMGYRFQGGTPLAFVERQPPFGAGSDPSNITDACYPYGSIQVPGGTEPIVLHRDAVSGGGYFMIGTVISADMDLIGQMQPNTLAQFVPVDMQGALTLRAKRASLIEAIRLHVAHECRV